MSLMDEDIVFQSVPVHGTAPENWRVRCPACDKAFHRRSAFRHFERFHKTSANGESPKTKNRSSSKRQQVPEDSDADDEQPEESVSRTSATREEQKDVAGDLPVDVVETCLRHMKSSPLRISSKQSSFCLIAPDLSVPALSAALKPGFTVQAVNFNDAHLSSLPDMDVGKDHDELTEVDIIVIEKGGAEGRERLAGAIILTGRSWLEIHCLEGYNRDIFSDPHAEPLSASPSSVPDATRGTQYCRRLKMTILHDGHGNPRLIIGVRSHNFLVTAGNHCGTLLTGPSRCGKFPVNEGSKLYIRRVRQAGNTFDDDILGLAQVRSSFGHSTTFSARRTAFAGHSAASQMPVTVFTLVQWNVAQASIFHRLWQRFKESGRPILRIEDLNPLHETDTPPGRLLRKLRTQLSENGTLDVSSELEADRTLSQLAEYFSGAIGDKNKIVQRNNSQAMPVFAPLIAIM